MTLLVSTQERPLPTLDPIAAIDTLVAFSRMVSDTTDAARIPDRLVASVLDHVGAAAAAVFTLADDGELRLAAVRGLEREELRTPSLEELVQSHGVVVSGADRFESVHVLVLVSAGGLFGALVLLFGAGARPGAEQLQLATALADLAGMALDRAHQTTQLVQTIEALHASREALARTEQLRVLGQMAAVVAHEVKNPLASITSVLQVLRGRFAADSQERRIMEQLLVRITDLDALVNDMLRFARPQQPDLRPVPLRALLEDARTALVADPAGAGVHLAIDGPDVLVRADVAMLRRMFLNLLLNAAQAMDGRGEIRVRWVVRGGLAEIEVADTGPGMPDEVRSRVFEAFFTTKSRGTGLGLAIVRQCVETHHGRIEVTCPPGGGTVFAIALPVTTG